MQELSSSSGMCSFRFTFPSPGEARIKLREAMAQFVAIVSEAKSTAGPGVVVVTGNLIEDSLRAREERRHARGAHGHS